MFGGRVMLASVVRIMWCHAEIETQGPKLGASFPYTRHFPAFSAIDPGCNPIQL
jgi:hypothetical protein